MTDRPRDPGLPWIFRGRQVRPFSLGVSVSAASFGALIITGGLGPIDQYNSALALAALAATTLLWAGWWTQRPEVLRQGLAVSAAVFAERTVYLFVVLGSWSAAGVSLGLAIAAGGGYLLEADHPLWTKYLRGLARE